MILKGLAIGIMVSAPMGPVGIFCIQRTLDKGRQAGLFTGVGAAISDMFYCLLAGFGLSLIEGFIERNQSIIQIIGSVVLVGFGIYLFRKNPSVDIKTPAGGDNAPGKDILTGFLFTFSNPLILFLIIGLFAQFNFMLPEHQWWHYMGGFFCIGAGALGWWWFVTFSVSKLRQHFNIRSMWLINRAIAIVVFIFAGIAIYTAVSNLCTV